MKLIKTRVTVLLALSWLLSLPALSVNPDELLPPEQAYVFSARVNTAGKVDFRWKIADGYYLYKSRIHFKSLTPGITLGEAQLPKGKVKKDEFFGTVETYRHKVRGRLPYQGQAAALELEVESQGCADIGVCYPPYRQTVKLELPGTATRPPVQADPKPVALNNLFATPEANDDGFLDPDLAFRADAIVDQPDRLLARFEPEKGYYLYKDKFRFRVLEPAGIGITANLPQGVFHDDPEFGRVEAYEEPVEIPLVLQRGEHSGATGVTLEMDYQGCKKDAICYPPQKKQITLQLPALPAGAATADVKAASTTSAPPPADSSKGSAEADTRAPLSEQDRLAASLAEQGWLAVLAFFGFGLLLAFTPCVFPMIPILSGIIAGQGDNMNARKGFVLSLVYVLAMAVTYTVAGILAGLFGQNLQAAFQSPWILGTFSLVFVALAFSMFGFFELQLPTALQSRLTEISNKQQGGNLVGVAIMGFLSALIVGPCVAPPLAAALIYIGQTQDPVLGGAALFALSMGMGVPLLLVGIGAGKYLPRAGGWMDGVKAVFGVMLLGLALWMLERILPGQLIVLGWGLLLLTSSVYMGAFEPLAEAVSGWRKLWKGLGLALALTGGAQLAGALAGADDWLEPLAPFRGGGTTTLVQAGSPQEKTDFITIHTEAELDQLMQQAKAEGKVLMLDFYADWCIECKRMEKNVFSRPHVQEKMARMLLVKADVTANDEENQKLLQRFGIIGPPATLFFAPDGRELKRWRLVGYLEADRFAQHLESLPQ